MQSVYKDALMLNHSFEFLKHVRIDRYASIRRFEVTLKQLIPVAFNRKPDANDLGSYWAILADQNEYKVDKGKVPAIVDLRLGF